METGERNGYRNAQATVLAPTGTISFLMDCDTTGIEPDFSLVKFKELVGGGQMTIVNRTVPPALRTLGYSRARGRADRGAPGRARQHRRRARDARRAPVGVRRGRGRAGDLGDGPREDDGRGSAVHLGRDLEDGEPARVGDGRGRRGGLHRGLEARPEGARDLPRRLEDRAGAAHRQEEGRAACEAAVGPAGGGRQAHPQADAARAPVAHAQVLDRRPRGLHHGRHVRGRHGRRDLPHRHRQGGLDAPGHDERVRHVDLDRAPVRRAARDAGAEVQLHALRPGGDHRQPGDPVREVDARLHHALAGLPLPRRRRARGARHPHARGAGAEGRRRRR